MSSELTTKVLTRFLEASKDPLNTKTAKTSMEPHVVRSALAMLEEMKEAEARLRKAVQFSRALRIEPSLEWIVDQLEEAHQSCEGVVKTTEDTLDYLNRR